MPNIRPVLGEIELQQVQQLDIDEDQVLVRHGIPALEGDFFQGLGRRGAKVMLRGVLTGPESGEGLARLRERFHAAEPMSFATDITSATRLDEVLIEAMEITELAGKPLRFEYAFVLREFTEASGVTEEPPEPVPPVPPLERDLGTLVVNVVAEGDPNFDFSRVGVSVRGDQTDGAPLFRVLTTREDNVWTEEDFPVGEYDVDAVVSDSVDMTGSAPATVRAGETTEVTIVLRAGAPVAKTFLVHFRFDNAFVEPCMRLVLGQVAEFAAANPTHKLVALGHTDLTGSTAYNQSLSERRARSAFAYLRFGNDDQAAVDEWDQLRRTRVSGVSQSVNDSWGTREYQHMLQDLGLYHGNVNGVHDVPTDESVREFQGQNGLVADGDVGDATWPVLIRAYLAQDKLSIPDDRLLPNCPDELLKWLGCSELDPVEDTENAWRPNRRTEFLFVRDADLPSDVTQPDTFNLVPVPGTQWCLNQGGTSTRCCFVQPWIPPGKESYPAPRRPPWTREPAEPRPSFVVRGSIRFEDGTPLANAEYFLTAPDGEYMDGEVAVTTSGRRAGTPLPGTTAADGTFEYPDPEKHKRPGVFTLEVTGDLVARLEGEPLENAKGNIVCKRLDGTDGFDVIVTPPHQRASSLEFVDSGNVLSTVESVQLGSAVRVRADVPSAQTDEVLVEITSVSSQVVPQLQTQIDFVDAGDTTVSVTDIAIGGRLRIVADAPGVSDSEIVIELTSQT